MKEEGNYELAEGIQTLIETKDIDNKKQFILQTETSYPYFQECIQKYEPSDEDFEPLEEEKSLAEAYNYIYKQLKDSINSIKQDKSLSEIKIKQRIENTFIDIRNKIIHLKLILIDLENEDDAYIIFETLNTRGKELTATDLVKNHITKLIKNENKNVDLIKDKWNEMIDTINSSQADINTENFLLHFWLSKYEYTSLKRLFKLIRKKWNQKSQCTRIS